MKPTWHIGDLIDLEYFLALDEMVDDHVIYARDRNIFLRDIAATLKSNGLSRKTDKKTAIRIWLEHRRKSLRPSDEGHSVLPGRLFTEILFFATLFLLISGFLTGAGLAFSILKYQGSEAVNVSVYFGVFVLLQILLIGLLAIFSFFRRFIHSLRYLSIIQWILGTVMGGLFHKIAARTKNALSAEKQNRVSSIAGMIKGQQQLYGSIFYWPMFLLAQIAGIGFNIGILGGSMLRIIGTDLAFGWQSTIQYSSRAVYLFVKTLALPWSFFLSPPLAHPTYEQIQGSRMILKEGMYHLTTPDLVSWWPFLLLAVCFYGFLPRMVLLITGMIAQKRALSKLDLNHASCHRLLRRMTTPRVETEGQMQADAGTTSLDDQPDNPLPLEPRLPAIPEQEGLVLVPEDIADHFATEGLEGIMQYVPGILLKHQVNISFDFEKDQEVLSEMILSHTGNNGATVLLLQEAWMPPIAETLLYLRKLREILGKKASIQIFLLGKPSYDHGFAPVSARDWRIWKRALDKLADPFLEIIGARKLG